MAKILQKDDPILRKFAKEVPLEDIGSAKLNKIIAEMTSALDKCEDGVALAAPQIGLSLRLFVVSPRAFAIYLDEEAEAEPEAKIHKESDKLVYINPVITKRSAKKNTLDEGCLSVRNIFGRIKRHEKVTISAYDESGAKFTRGASGLLAEIFQHEVDHLDGILFIDSATNLAEVGREKAKDNEQA